MVRQIEWAAFGRSSLDCAASARIFTMTLKLPAQAMALPWPLALNPGVPRFTHRSMGCLRLPGLRHWPWPSHAHEPVLMRHEPWTIDYSILLEINSLISYLEQCLGMACRAIGPQVRTCELGQCASIEECPKAPIRSFWGMSSSFRARRLLERFVVIWARRGSWDLLA